jgi:DUF4097 and DUF4098 domain-containing protein YvlB
MRVTIGVVILLWGEVARADGGSATRTDPLTISGPLTALELSAVSGEIHVSSATAFSGSVKLVVQAATQAEAAAVLKQLSLDSKFEDGRLRVRAQFPDHGRPRGVKIEAHFEVKAPPGTATRADLVDGNTRIENMTGRVEVRAVNGTVQASGMTRDVRLSSVNGSVEAHLGAVGASSKVEADTVNGPLTLWFPPATGLRLSAQTLNGEILSTFPFPAHNEGHRFGPFNKQYSGSVGNGDVQVKMRSVNGQLAVLANGSALAKAKPVVVVTESDDSRSMGAMPAIPPMPPVPPMPPGLSARQMADYGRRMAEMGRRIADRQRRMAESMRGLGAFSDDSDDVKRDKVTGDLDVDRSSADISVETVTGRVRVRTRSGDVRIGSVGGPAQIDTKGGNVHVHTVGGELTAESGGGDLRVDSAGANVRLETKGGDIRVGSCAGSVVARTKAGDIVAKAVKGAVSAETEGGDIVVEVVGKVGSGGIELATHGGDVALTLPRNFDANVSIEADEADEDDTVIASEFSEVTVTRKGHGQTAAGKLGKGGPNVTVRTRSGAVTLKKGPAL